MKPWTWQQCTELGWFNGPNPAYPISAMSLNKEVYSDYCKRIFGPTVPFHHGVVVDIDQEDILVVHESLDPW